ncbi:hypothetical protein DWG95_16870 [Escherichia coli]|nr:hypothetical protein [Escherichia coli]
MTDIKEQYTNIIESGNSEQFIAFLKTQDEKLRNTLVPLIKRDVKRLYEQFDRQSGRYKATAVQLDMLGVAILSCFTWNDIKKLSPQLVRQNNTINRVLQWYCPPWFAKFINLYIQESHKRGYGFIFYEELAEWLSQGYLERQTLEDETIAQTLVPPHESLEKYPFYFEEHIWLVFHYPNYLSTRWLESIKTYTKNQRLDRFRLLNESLLAVNRGFNKDQTNFYATLFSALEPTGDECLQLQDELIATFCCPHSKPVTTSLQAIKKILDNDDFHRDEFLTQLPLLLSSTTKGVVDSTLTITDKLAKQNPEKRAEICQHLTGVFINKDASLQNKAEKLIAKYGSPTEPELSSLLMSYADNILIGARELLTDFLDTKPMVVDEAVQLYPVMPLIRDDNRIPEIETWDDFIFLVGRAFHNLDSFSFDQLPAALLCFSEQINKDNIEQLIPAFANALKTLHTWSGTQGSFDKILASFFMEFADFIQTKYHNENIDRQCQKYHELINHQDKYQKLNWGFNEWQKSTKAVFQPWINILLNTLTLLKKSSGLPLLSTPTHLPCFIEPRILIDRLYRYQQAGESPCGFDFQLAIQRCVPGTESLLPNDFNRQYSELMNYLRSGNVSSLDAVNDDDLVLTAILTRQVFLPDVDSYTRGNLLLAKRDTPVEILKNKYDWKLLTKVNQNQYTNKEIVYKQLHFDIPRYWHDENSTLFYEYSFMRFPEGHSADRKRILFSFPWHSEAMLARFIAINFKNASKEAREIINLLQAMLELPLPLLPMGHLLTAFCMLHADKTVRALAGELWIEKLRYPQGVNSTHIGDILGRLEKESWAPLKRFTDLAMQSLINISFRHNQALLEMVCAMDSHLSTVKITNYKKLTELRQELEGLVLHCKS